MDGVPARATGTTRREELKMSQKARAQLKSRINIFNELLMVRLSDIYLGILFIHELVMRNRVS